MKFKYSTKYILPLKKNIFFCDDSNLKVLARSWWFAEKLDTYLAKKTNKQNVHGLFGESVFEYNDAWNIVNFVTLKQCNLATKMWKL